MSIYDKLNEPQREAVYHTDGPLLILAGAGSGKTRVLTHRIAYLIGERGVNPWNILAITFTNKAAEEMRQRVDNLVGFGAESVWVSTFHSACVRILRRFIDRLGYENHFTIYDTDDQKTLIKEVCRKVDVDTKVFKERSLLSAISSAKNEMILPDEFELNAGGDFAKMKIAKVYREYEAQMRANNVLDFDDLLVKTVQLLQTQPDVLESYQERFRYIMVDEYQDTNEIQEQIFNALRQAGDDAFFVGDVKQSIYGFRLADPDIFLDRYLSSEPYETACGSRKRLALNQNFRSRQEVLELCNYCFSRLMTREFGGVDYDEEQRLRCTDQPGCQPSEVLLLDWGENPRDENMVRIARELGYDLKGITTPITRENLQEADSIVVFDEGHRNTITRVLDYAHWDRIVMFDKLAFGTDTAVMDPHYQSDAVYRSVASHIVEGCKRMIERWKNIPPTHKE